MILLTVPVISIMASLILVLPLIIGSINIKEINQSPIKIIFIYCIVYSIYEIIGWVYALNGWQNHFVSNIISYTDVIVWGCYYYQIIKNKQFKYLGVSLGSITLILILWSHIGTGRDFNRIDSFAYSIVNIFLISIVLMFFYQLLNSIEIENLFTYSHFWIAVAVLIYFSGIFSLEIFAEYIAFNKDKTITRYWEIKEYLTFIHRILLAVGFWFSQSAIAMPVRKLSN